MPSSSPLPTRRYLELKLYINILKNEKLIAKSNNETCQNTSSLVKTVSSKSKQEIGSGRKTFVLLLPQSVIFYCNSLSMNERINSEHAYKLNFFSTLICYEIPQELIFSIFSYRTQEDQLDRTFREFGAIEKIHLVVDPEGRSRGFAFITYFTMEVKYN